MTVALTHRRGLTALVLVLVPAFAACIASPDSVATGDDAGTFEPDGAPAAFDASGQVDAPFLHDAGPGVDSTVANDAGSAADTSIADSPTADTTVSDASAPDVFVPPDAEDAGTAAVPDASGAGDASDANVPDVFDAAEPDAADANQPDVYDAGIWCVTAVLGDYYARSDGSLVYTPSQTVVTGLPGGTTIVDLEEQIVSSCALVSNGTVWCWATNTSSGNADGDLGNGVIGGTTTPFAATQVVTQPLDAGAEVALTGVSKLESQSVTAISHPTCVIKGDKSVWCWGNSTASGSPPAGIFWGTTGSTNDVPYAIEMSLSQNDAGPNPPILADLVSVGADHICYVLSGQVHCFGENVSGNLANGDGTLAFQPYPLPVVAANGFPSTTVTAIGSGYRFTCVLAQGGTVWCWGSDSAYEIGDPSAPTNFCNLNYCEPVPTPVQVTQADGGPNTPPDGGIDVFPLTGATEMRTGYLGACALVGGELQCWGAYGPKGAAPFASTLVPYTGIASFTMAGSDEDFPAGLRYLTPIGLASGGTQVITPMCQ